MYIRACVEKTAEEVSTFLEENNNFSQNLFFNFKWILFLQKSVLYVLIIYCTFTSGYV